jgi:hypothetical protein
MSRLLPLQGALKNLKGEIPEGPREYLPREQALEFLKRLSGEDFGYDVERWREWIRKHPYGPRRK